MERSSSLTVAAASSTPQWVMALDAPQACLETVGGKGANLARLAQAGLPVPGGFHLTVAAYREFLAANQLAEPISHVLESHNLQDAQQLEQAAARVQALFLSGRVPEPIRLALLSAYAALGEPAVAVRSSATAEDLPDLSFAGQQDTYLNIRGPEALLHAVVRCWASLWTARAIGYRTRSRIDHASAALAVVVQELVPSLVSGVLFTADPLTGSRQQVAIDATWGLGEALVSGRVEPDHYLVGMPGGQIIHRRLGSKSVVLHPSDGGGLREAGPVGAAGPCLMDDQVRALAALGKQVEALYHGETQDIEFAIAGGETYVLQARPITTLYPIPAGLPASPPRVLFSFGAVQGMLAPITPLGRDALRAVFAAGSGMFGYTYDYRSLPALREAGERLWIDITPVLSTQVGQRVALFVLTQVEPSTGQALRPLLAEPVFSTHRRLPSLRAAGRMARFYPGMAIKILRNWLAPDRRRAWINARADEALRRLQSRVVASGSGAARLAASLALFDEVPGLVQGVLPLFLSELVSGIIPLNLLHKLAASIGPAGSADPLAINRLALEVTRGLPHNVTTEMDLALWSAAEQIQADKDSRAVFLHRPVQRLAEDLQAGRLPTAARRALAGFLSQYGMRGVGEIDLGQPRWREDPTAVLQTLRGYLEITQPDQSPAAVFRNSAAAGQQAVEELVLRLRNSRSGWLKARLARWAAGRVRALLGQRESPKFFAIRVMGILRANLLASGEALAQEGVVERPEDLFYLRLDELHRLAAQDPADWKALVRERRAACAREQRRARIPRLLLSDGRAFYEGAPGAEAPDDQTLVGSPVSPGVAEGIVRVVLDPRAARLQRGEVLVCPGTDPAWTPLFLTAGALVMEVGGMMTHGAVVAREYGIPAVVGVRQATTRLADGDRVRVDGARGTVTILEAAAARSNR